MTSYLEDTAVATDRLLVERHLAGDQSAFGELYRRHYDRLVRFLRVRGYSRDLAEDLAQEAFARALAALEGLRDPSRFYPWLTVIARHLVVQHHRNMARLCLVADVDGVSGADAPDSQLLRRQDEKDVQRALERVRVRHREILELRERDELSYEDIALRLGTPATTVPPLLFRAREAFRREYLLVTEGDRKPLIVFPGVVEAWRRLRARAGHYAAWLPDANALCASATCVALGVGAIIAGVGAPRSVPSSDSYPMVALNSGRVDVTGDPPSAGEFGIPAATRSRTAGHLGEPTLEPKVVGLAEVTTTDTTFRRNRDRARQMPIYHEIGPAWFSADPDAMRRDIESSLRGDTEWMEGGR